MPHTPPSDVTQSPRKDPYKLKLSEDARRELASMLCREIRAGLQSRSLVMQDNGLIDFAYALYEQQREGRRGADLTSPIGTENVDALSARAVKTVFVEPLWIVEGSGESAKRAPIVEEYLQWRQERIRFQKTCSKTIRAALIEEGAVLEACEDVDPIFTDEVIKAAVLRNEVDGSFVVDAKTGKPQPQYDEAGELVPAVEGDDYVQVHRSSVDPKRRGARFQLHSMKDVLFFPSHARDDGELYGQAFRFWRRLDQLKADIDTLGYDREAVERLGTSNERTQRPEHDRAGVSVQVESHGPESKTQHEEAELWRVQFLANLDGQGMCFYIATVSEYHEVILRIQKDWLPRFRGAYCAPYPRTYSVYSYSMILGKLLTTIEEHTAWRNMNADRGTMKANAPLKRLHSSQWHPDIQPFGAGQVIDVADMNEVQPFEFDDISQGALDRERTCVMDAQRIIGINDIAVGQVSKTNRTLGENEMATEQSFVRMEDPIRHIQEFLEDVGELFHAIEVKTLEEMDGGIEVPGSVADNLRFRGQQDFDGTVTADMIKGSFRFKPRGSVEGADPMKRLAVQLQGIDKILSYAQANQQIFLRTQTPEFADAIMQVIVEQMKPRDKQAFLRPIQPPMMPGMPGQGMLPEGMPQGPNFGGDDLIAQLSAALPQAGVQ